MARDADAEWAMYRVGAAIIGGVAFLGSWGYAVARYGWFLGLGLGWLPAAVIGAVVGLLWPLVALAALVLFLYLT